MTRARRALRLAALAALLAAAATGAWAWYDREPRAIRMPAEALEGARSELVGCDADGVWVRVARRVAPGEAAEGDHRTSLVRFDVRDRTTEKALPPGILSGFSRSGDGVLHATVLTRDGGAFLHASADGGATWTDTPVSEALLGVAFATRRSGYAWTASELRSTANAGATWSRTRVAGALRRGMNPGHPVLGPDGRLWVPVNPATSAPGSRSELWLVAPELSVVRTWSFAAHTVEGVAVHDAGTATVLLRPVDRTGFTLRRVGAPGADVEWTRANGSATTLVSAGAVALLLGVEDRPPASWFGTWPRFSLWTREAGRTWDDLDVRAHSACVAEGRAWLLDRGGLVLRTLD